MAINALITGGSSGIGEYLAKRLASTGNKVYLIGRTETKLRRVSDEIIQSGNLSNFMSGDVSNSSFVKSCIQDAIDKMGTIDLLVANAGTGHFNNIEDLTEEDFDISMNTNVKGVFLFLREIIPLMKSKEFGQIIVTSSNLGFHTSARCSLYCATKFAIQGMVGSIRKELEGTKVKIGTINPGSVDTPWFKDFTGDPINHRLDVEEVVDAMMLMINQGERSNIDHILLNPTYKK